MPIDSSIGGGRRPVQRNSKGMVRPFARRTASCRMDVNIGARKIGLCPLSNHGTGSCDGWELDRDTPVHMAQTLFPLLTGAPWRRLSVLSGGTHTILMERHRMLLFRSVQQFLEEAPPATEALA